MIAKFDGLEPRRCEDIKGIVAPEIGPQIFATFEKQAQAQAQAQARSQVEFSSFQK